MEQLSDRSASVAECPAHELHARIAELEHALAARDRTIAELREQTAGLQRVIDHIPYALYWKDHQLVYQGCNRRFADDLGLGSAAEIIGKSDGDLAWQPEEVETFRAVDQRILASQRVEYDDDESVIHPSGDQEWFETYKIPLIDSGASVGVLATYNNITARKRAEATIRAQALQLQELATPVIPLTDEILILPIVGAVDTARASQVLAAVLGHVEASHARTVMIDITGVAMIDTPVAHVLVQLEQAVRLLGAQLVITGMRPEVAQALVGLGVALGGIVTYSSMQRAMSELAGWAAA
jgi:rsbT co-antagonist protein RsbR